jgi:hypothetical protein
VNAASAQPAPKTLARLAVASGQGLCEGAGAVGVAGLCSVITAWICRSATCGPNCVMHRPWNSRRKIAAMRARCWRFDRNQCDVGGSHPVRSGADKGQVPRDDPDAASGLRRLGSGRRSTTPNARASTAPRPRFGCRRTRRATRRVQRPVVTVCSSAGVQRVAQMPIYLQSPPDLQETSKLAHPVITDHLFLSERHTRTLERYDH